jgi:hypothetical protein
MKTITTFLSALLFLTTCLLSWLIFPILLIVSGGALFTYAFLAELCVSLPGPKSSDSTDFASRKIADRLCGKVRSQRTA